MDIIQNDNQQEQYRQNQNYVPPNPPKKKIPVAVIVISCIVLFFAVIGGVLTFYGRDIAIKAVGTKKYYENSEMNYFKPQLAALSKQLAQKQIQYNSGEISGNLAVNDADGILVGDQIGSQIGDITKNLTYDLKFGKNADKKSLGASLDFQYKNSKLLTATGTINSDRLVVASPELLDKSVYFTPSDIPAFKPIFEYSSKLATFTNESLDQKEVQTELLNIVTQMDQVLSNDNVTIDRNKDCDIGGVTYTCDEITVKLSENEVKNLLTKMVDTAKNSDELNKLSQQSGLYSEMINTILNNFEEYGYIDNSDSFKIDTNYDSILKTIDGLKLGNVTMTVYLKNSLIHSEILKREIKTGNGYSFSNYNIGTKGEFQINLPKSEYSTVTEFNVPYTNTADEFSASCSVSDADNTKTNISLLLNKKDKTDIGYYPSEFTINTELNGDKFEISAALSNKSGKTQVDLNVKQNDKDLIALSSTISLSQDIFSIPDFIPGKSINLYTADNNDIYDMSNQLGNNLKAIFDKLGISLY